MPDDNPEFLSAADSTVKMRCPTIEIASNMQCNKSARAVTVLVGLKPAQRSLGQSVARDDARVLSLWPITTPARTVMSAKPNNGQLGTPTGA